MVRNNHSNVSVLGRGALQRRQSQIPATGVVPSDRPGPAVEFREDAGEGGTIPSLRARPDGPGPKDLWGFDPAWGGVGADWRASDIQWIAAFDLVQLSSVVDPPRIWPRGGAANDDGYIPLERSCPAGEIEAISRAVVRSRRARRPRRASARPGGEKSLALSDPRTDRPSVENVGVARSGRLPK